MSSSRPMEVARLGALPCCPGQALGSCTGGRSRSPGAWVLSSMRRPWVTPEKAGVLSSASVPSPTWSHPWSAWGYRGTRTTPSSQTYLLRTLARAVL